MRIVLNATVYTANRGYAWSSVPEGTTTEELEGLLKLASALRPEFPSEEDVTQGAVSDGTRIAVFTIRNVPAWDSEGRPAEYAAFVLVDHEIADKVDFAALLRNRFFQVPLKTPPPFVMYEGPEAPKPALDVPGKLLCRNALSGFAFAETGSLLAAHAAKSPRWTFELNPETGLADVKTAPWHAMGKSR